MVFLSNASQYSPTQQWGLVSHRREVSLDVATA
jgi:hypothetical protein